MLDCCEMSSEKSVAFSSPEYLAKLYGLDQRPTPSVSETECSGDSGASLSFIFKYQEIGWCPVSRIGFVSIEK